MGDVKDGAALGLALVSAGSREMEGQEAVQGGRRAMTRVALELGGC